MRSPRLTRPTALTSRLLSLSLAYVLLAAMLPPPGRSAAPAPKAPAVEPSAQPAPPVPAAKGSAAEEQARRAYGQLPLRFEANRGQFGPEVKYVTRAGSYTVMLTATEAVIVAPPQRREAGDAQRALEEDGTLRGVRDEATPELSAAAPDVVRMKIEGANASAAPAGAQELPGKLNYFVGDDPSRWLTGVPTYSRVEYKDVYPGIDLVYYGNQRQMEYDFRVAPGVSADQISLAYDGARSVKLDKKSGDLLLETSRGVMRQHSPVVYQETADGRKAVRSEYKLGAKGRVKFKLGSYDRSKPLVIDPILSYSTYLGGDSDLAYAVAVDSAGSAYVTGETWGLTFFEGTPGVTQPYFGGSSDAFVAKLNPAGTDLVYGTFVGSTGFDFANDIAVDAAGNAYVTGRARFNFPVTAGAFNSKAVNNAYSDAFVFKLNAAGSQLVYSSRVGGEQSDFGHAVAIDAQGSAYVTGYTRSADFPTTAGAAQASYSGGEDAYALKLDPTGSTLLYSTYVGGSSADYGYGIAVDGAGNAYVGGSTYSSNLPVTPGAAQTAAHGANRGLFKSTNGASTFSLKNSGLQDPFVQSLAVHPTNPLIVYAGAAGGVYKSTDGGTSWAATGLSRKAAAFRGLVIDKNNPSVLYVGSAFDGVYKTTDGGNTWAAASNGLVITSTEGQRLAAVTTIEADPTNSAVLYAGTQLDGLFRTADGGASWTRFTSGISNKNITDIAIDPATPSTLYASANSGGANSGVFKSTNSGSSWSVASTGIPAGFPVRALAINPSSPAILYAATNQGVYKTTTGGANWSAVNTGLTSVLTDNSTRVASVFSLAIDPTNPATVYAGQTDVTYVSGNTSAKPFTAVYKSTDAGATWVRLSSGVGNLINTISAIAIDPTNTSVVYVSTHGDQESFLTKVNPAGTSFTYSTYFGGERHDYAQLVGLDSAANVYLAGATQGAGFNATPGAYQTALGGSIDMYVAKFGAGAHQLAYSTMLGGASYEDVNGFEVDGAGNAYVMGLTLSSDFVTTPGAFQRNRGAGGLVSNYDATVTKLNPSGSGVVFSSYLGGGGDELEFDNFIGSNLALDPSGRAYVAGYTDSVDFPITDDAFQFGFSPRDDNDFTASTSGSFVAKIDETINSFSITGRLLRSNGTPITDAFVEVTGTQERFVSTDARGFYAVNNLPQGTYTVTPRSFGGFFTQQADRYAFTPPSLTFNNVSTDQTADFTGSPLVVIAGRVTSSTNGLGLRNITVTLGGSATGTASTDRFGFYQFSVPSGGSYSVTPSRAGFTFSPGTVNLPNLTADQTNANFTTASAAFFTVSGQVTVSGEPVQGAAVSCLGTTENTQVVFTNASGNYTCTNLQQGESFNVRPSFPRATFTPASQTFNNISANQTQNFAGATAAGLTGKMVFTSFGSAGTGIFIMNADGTNLKNLNSATGGAGFDTGPELSFDGTKIVFAAYSTNSLSQEIFVMNADGTGVTQITSDDRYDNAPTWSPDGTKVAFIRDHPDDTDANDIMVVNADGTGLTNLTPGSTSEHGSPAWSPDGTKIAFHRSPTVGDEPTNIFVMNANGSNIIQLTNDGNSFSPAWSPDGTKIAFTRFNDVNQPSSSHVYVMNADGTGQTAVTSDPLPAAGSFNDSPTWSPDGTKIAFARNSGDYGIYVINTNGTGLVRVTDYTSSSNFFFPAQPSWRPGSVAGSATFTVTNTNNSGIGSLRQAIIDANNSAGQDTIRFSIPGSGVKTINVLSQLPTSTGPVVIDGTTQGFSSEPLVELNGAGAGAANGLEIHGGNSLVRGLIINRFRNGIALRVAGGNRVESCFIGTNSSGTAAAPNTETGVWVDNTPNNVVGGFFGFCNTFACGGNIISGNTGPGVFIQGAAATGNVVAGNFIGTNIQGTSAVPNNGGGVEVRDASGNVVGGTGLLTGNLISGNANYGVHIRGAGAANNVVQGNRIGTGPDGASALANNGHGVMLEGAGNNNLVGGTSGQARNIISGNTGSGVVIDTTSGARVEGNFIGTNATGSAAVPNSAFGVQIGAGSTNNTVGGAAAGAGNVISGNFNGGVQINGNGNRVYGNNIGTSANGTTPVSNGGGGGVSVAASNNQIGGTLAGQANLIAYNSGLGVRIISGGGNSVLSNSIFNNAGQAIGLTLGANNNQPAPQMTVAALSANGAVTQGVAKGAPSTTLTVQLFASTDCNQGERLLGSVVVATDAAGNAPFSGNFPQSLDGRKFVTATATDPAGNTSAITTCAQVVTNTAFISGRVTDVTGEVPLAGVVVTLSGTLTRVVQTDVKGNYDFPNLTAGGNYTVTAQSPYYGFVPAREEFLSLSGPQTANFKTQNAIPPTIFPPPTDSFDGGARDPNKWNLGTMSQPVGAFSPAVTVVQASGNLVITPTATPGYNGYVSVNAFDLTNGAAGVELVQAGAGGTETVFAVGENPDNFYRFVVSPNQGQGPAGKGQRLIPWLAADELVLHFQVKINGQVTEAAIPYDPVQHKFLRFRHDAPQNSINFETSPNSTAWTVRRSFGPLSKGVSALTCELSAGTTAPTSAPGQTVFNNFNLTTNTVRFLVAATRVNEQTGTITVTVRREGSTAGAASVGYQTAADTAAVGSDFQAAQGTLQFAAGETEKTFSLTLADDSVFEGDESFDVLLGTPTAAGLDSPGRHRVTIADNEGSISDPRFFSRQHYLDFFGREPDQAGWDFWTGQTTNCGNPDLLVCRINVSAAFFVSIEFQETGYLVHRAYGAALGTRRIGNRVPLTLQEFTPDLQQIGAGIIVGQGDWQAKLEANKTAYFDSFVQRPAFTALYPQTMSPTQYVDALNQNTVDPQNPAAGGALSPTERAALIADLTSGAKTRARALRAVAEDPDFYGREYNRAFVLMQYFGYLHRNPPDAPELNRDFAGYDFWLGKLNEFNGNYVAAEMVKAFITSGEYLGRF